MLLGKIFVSFAERSIYKSSVVSKLCQSLQTRLLCHQSVFCITTNAQDNLDLQHHIKSIKTIDVLKRKGISSFFPIQSKSYSPIFQGNDLIAGDKTGSGKTIAFTLPVIQKLRIQGALNNHEGIKFLVLAPTRQLAAQIGQQIQSLKHTLNQYRVLTVFGGVPYPVHYNELKKNPDILVGTPGRIIDLMQKGCINFNKLKVVCVDQADFMFDIGFKDHIDNILSTARQQCKQKYQVLCFSATINKQVADLTKKFMNDHKVVIKLTEQIESKSPTTIRHEIVEVESLDKILALRHLIKNKSKDGRTIIFTNTKIQASNVSDRLKIKNVVLHGDIEQNKRLSRLKLFKQGSVKILIASDVAARGLDIPNVQLVINYDPPKNTSNYLHRSGRTGRAGKEGICVTLLPQGKKSQISSFVNISKQINVKLKRVNIQSQQYQKVKNIKQEDAPRQAASQFLSTKGKNFRSQPTEYIQNELVLFLNKIQISKEQLENLLRPKKKQFKIKQLKSNKTGNKFYIIIFPTKYDAQDIMNDHIVDEKTGYQIQFSRNRVKNPNRNNYSS